MATPESTNVTDDRFVSFEWAKKLAEAGYLQRAFMWIAEYQDHPKAPITHFLYTGSNDGTCGLRVGERHKTIYACPMAEEILRKLPMQTTIERDEEMWIVTTDGLPDKPEHRQYSLDGTFGRRECASTLASAAAAMYCFLKENHLLHS